jgi:ABC-type dipeptide/oligopeptide/nickel transport system permease subunit
MNTLETLLTAAVTAATPSLVAGTVSAAAVLALGAAGQLFKIDSATQKVTATVASLPGTIIVIALMPAIS